MAVSPVDRVVRSARRRLFVQTAINRLVAAWAVALVVALTWFLAEPLLLESSVRWTVLASLVVIATLAAVGMTIRRAPSRLDSALELDSRFTLRERVTSVLSLPEQLRGSPAGRALLADAEKHVAPLRVREKFALFLPRSAVRVPVFAALIALVAFVYHPVTDSPAWAESQKKQTETASASTSADGKRPTAKPADRPRVEPERANKSPQVKELEAELDRLDRLARDTNPTAEQVREKITEITAAEEKAKAAEREAFDKLSRMENKMRQLEKLSGAEDFKDGPAKELNDALAKGDLAQAEEAVEELRKKVRNKSLDPKDAEQLDKQLDQMRSELQRLARNTDEQEKLRKLIDQAKQEGRDTESLDRELERIKLDAEQMKALEELAKKLDLAKNAMRGGNPAETAKALEQLAEQLRDIQGQVGDLQDLQEQLRRVEEMKAQAGEQGPGGEKGGGEKGNGEKGGTGKAIGGLGKGQGAVAIPMPGVAQGGGVGAGKRPENPNAATAKGSDERQRTPFDPKGRKSYGGAVPGPAFTKRSPAEVSGAISVAAQEAADAIANQPLSRDDKEAVKEFIQGLGNQKKP